MILNVIYRKVAKRLTEWENHRTQSEFEHSLIVKNFIFQFVNSYISLFYIAFVKGNGAMGVTMNLTFSFRKNYIVWIF